MIGWFFHFPEAVMTQQIKLNVKPRESRGRGPAGRMRKEGLIPGVVYGKTSEARPISVDQSEFSRMMKQAAGAASLVQLKEEGSKGSTLSVIQETQVDPITDRILHLDFHEVSSKEKMDTNVTIHFNGEAIGVKNEGGLLDIVLHSVDVRCLPKDLPGFIEIDVSELKIDEAIHIKELPELPGVEYLADEDQVVVSCAAPRVEVEPEETPAEEEASEEESQEKSEEGEEKEQESKKD